DFWPPLTRSAQRGQGGDGLDSKGCGCVQEPGMAGSILHAELEAYEQSPRTCRGGTKQVFGGWKFLHRLHPEQTLAAACDLGTSEFTGPETAPNKAVTGHQR